jgi:hypothetical protein
MIILVPITLVMGIPLSALSLSAVSVIYGQLWLENIK